MRLKLFMTSECNLRCLYCYEKSYRHKNEGDLVIDLSNDNMIAILLDIVEQRMVSLKDYKLQVDFYGGEPLLEIEKIMQVKERIIERFSTLDIAFSVTTNGTLLNKKNVVLLQNFTVSVSCDGDEKQNQYRVDKAGCPAFDKIIGGIALLSEKQIKFKVNIVVRSTNYFRVIKSIKYLVSMNCRHFALAIDYSDNGWEYVTDEELKNFYDSLKEFALENYHIFKITLFEDSVIPLNQCYLTETLAVDTNGDVYPCIYFVTAENSKKYCLGNICDGYEKLQWGIIDKMSKYIVCDKDSCSSKEGNCKIGCYGMNLQLTGNVNTISSVYCRHLRASYNAIFKYRMKVLRKLNKL